MAGGYATGIDTSYKVTNEEMYKNYNTTNVNSFTVDKSEIYKDYVP